MNKDISEGESGRWRAIWEYHNAADNLFHQRFTFFLVAESMLIVSFATLMIAIDKIPKSLQVAIPILGIVYTFAWWYTNHRIEIRMNSLKVKYLEKDYPIYKGYMNSVKNRPLIDFLERPLSIFSNVLPGFTFGFWFFILLDIVLKISLLWTFFIMAIAIIIIICFLPRKNY